MSKFTYKAAVQHLADVALTQSGSGARVAASVLISANSGSFKIAVPDLCLLDETNLAAAYTVISNRVATRQDAESQIENGSEIMQQIFNEWKRALLKAA